MSSTDLYWTEARVHQVVLHSEVCWAIFCWGWVLYGSAFFNAGADLGTLIMGLVTFAQQGDFAGSKWSGRNSSPPLPCSSNQSKYFREKPTMETQVPMVHTRCMIHNMWGVKGAVSSLRSKHFCYLKRMKCWKRRVKHYKLGYMTKEN